MRLAAGGVTVLLGLVVAQAALDDGRDPGDAVRGDARRVHCLSAKQRPALLETAVRLGEAAPGSTDAAFRPLKKGRSAPAVTLDQWSRESGTAFERVCKPLAALSGAKTLQDPAPRPPLWRRIPANPLFNLVTGALLTFATTWIAAGTARRQTLADHLTTAAGEYLKAAEAARAARARQAPVDQGGLEGRRVDLWSAILRIGLPDAERRGLHRMLEETHEAVVGRGFDSVRVHDGLRRLADALANAIRGESAGSAPGGGP